MFSSHANIIKSDLVLLIGGIELDSFFFYVQFDNGLDS